MDPAIRNLPIAVWELLALAAICLFFAAVGLTFLCIRYRCKGTLALCLVLVPGCYFLAEGFLILQTKKSARGAAHFALKNFFLNLPPWVLIPAILGLIAIMVLLLRRTLRFGGRNITPGSVKEAVDSLPEGICCFRPWGRIVLANTAMEALCRRATGEILTNGRDFRESLASGQLRPGCRLTDNGGETLLVLPDGSAHSFREQNFDWEGEPLTVLLAANVTEAYRKTLALEEQNRRLTELNRQLAARNREIVDLTIQSEILAARVRLHDAMGEDLLAMKKLLLEGDEPEATETVRRRLRRSVSFLRDNSEYQAADEFAVLMQTAERLGVRVELEGVLPKEEPFRRVVATGLHECLTNLLRHAHGNLLRMELRAQGDKLTVIYTGNGEPPKEPVRETGGLRILRTLTEQVGGSMAISTEPSFTVTLTLNKEASYGISRIDCGRSETDATAV